MARALQPCGTRGAYQRHRAYGQVPCEACTRAHTAYNKRNAARRRAPVAEQAALFRQLLDLITGECRRAGMLP